MDCAEDVGHTPARRAQRHRRSMLPGGEPSPGEVARATRRVGPPDHRCANHAATWCLRRGRSTVPLIMCDRSAMETPRAKAARRPTAVDLFAGAGGLSLGFESAGFDVLAAVEYDPVHAATHGFNFPNTQVLCRDVRTITGAQLIEAAHVGWLKHYPEQRWSGVLDAIVGGPSCQGFSVMGSQAPDDARNELVLEFVRLVEEVRPRTLCMENVPGFLDDRFVELRTEVTDRLVAAGYRLTGFDRVLRAEDYGVPQRRRRVIILGSNVDCELPASPLATHPVSPTVADAFSGMPSLESYPDAQEASSIRLSAADACLVSGADSEYLAFGGILSDGGTKFGHRRVTDSGLMTGVKLTRHTPDAIARFKATPQGGREAVSRYHRLALDEPALTLRAGTGRERGAFSAARPLHPTEPRVITVREAARLHSFPDWFRFHETNWHGNRQVGNAVPPLLAAAAARSLLAALRVEATVSTLDPLRPGDDDLLRLSPTRAAELLGADPRQVPAPRQRQETSAPQGTSSGQATTGDPASCRPKSGPETSSGGQPRVT